MASHELTSPMRFIDAACGREGAGISSARRRARGGFSHGSDFPPPRHHHTIKLEGRPDATLLLMPAWTSSAPGAETAGRYIGIKQVTVFPDNSRLGKPAIYGAYLLLSTETGEPLALIDAPTLTVWRTAAASALAARFLAKPDATRMLMVGAGALAPYLVRAHASVRPIREVMLWNRTRSKAEALQRKLANSGLALSVVGDLEGAVRTADLISTATISSAPLMRCFGFSPAATSTASARFGRICGRPMTTSSGEHEFGSIRSRADLARLATSSYL